MRASPTYIYSLNHTQIALYTFPSNRNVVINIEIWTLSRGGHCRRRRGVRWVEMLRWSGYGLGRIDLWNRIWLAFEEYQCWDICMASQDWSNGQYVITEIARTCLRTGDVVSGPYLWSKSSLSPEITTWNFDVHTYKIWSYPREGIFHLHPTCDRLYVAINGMCSVTALIYWRTSIRNATAFRCGYLSPSYLSDYRLLSM